MKNQYKTPEVLEVDKAQNVILGAKELGPVDSITTLEGTRVVDPDTDIDE